MPSTPELFNAQIPGFITPCSLGSNTPFCSIVDAGYFSTIMKIPTSTGGRFHFPPLNRLLIILLLALSASLDTRTAARAGNVYVDRTLQAQLATLGPIAQIQAVVNFDPAVRRGAAIASAIRNLGAGAITFYKPRPGGGACPPGQSKTRGHRARLC